MSASRSPGTVSYLPDVVGQIPGTATNDGASVGNIGEYATATLASGSAVGLSNSTATTIAALALSAGDWDVWGQAIFKPGALTVTTLLTAGINTSAAQPSLGAGGLAQIGLGGGLTGIADTTVNVGPQRITLGAAGTAYLMGTLLFSVSTASVYGFLASRRRR